MKCDKCGRTIKNAHYLNGKKYGYSCYCQELALFLADKEQKHNDEWNTKCMILVDVLRTKNTKNSFIFSIIEQHEKYGKLTALQFKTVFKNLSKVEKFEYELQGFELGVEDNPRWIFNKNQTIMALYFNNPRIKIMNPVSRRTNEKSNFLVEYKDEDFEKSTFDIMNKKRIDEYKNDEYIEFVKVSEAF